MISDKNNWSRRKILTTIGAGTIIGSAVVPNMTAAKQSDPHLRKELNRPKTEENVDLQKFNPHNLSEVRSIGKTIERMNEGKVDSLGKHLSEKQKESVADAFKLTDMRITTARHSSATSEKRKMPRNKSLSVMAGGQNTDIITTSSQSIRDDIGKKWGWKK